MQFLWLSGLLFLNILVTFTSAIKPTKYAKEVVCEGCHAFITESTKLMNRKHTSRDSIDVQIRDALKRTCNAEHLRAYEFSPPNMAKVCDYWITEYKEEIIEVFKEFEEPLQREISLCFDVTDACIGVDRTNFRINKYKGPSSKAVREQTGKSKVTGKKKEKEEL